MGWKSGASHRKGDASEGARRKSLLYKQPTNQATGGVPKSAFSRSKPFEKQAQRALTETNDEGEVKSSERCPFQEEEKVGKDRGPTKSGPEGSLSTQTKLRREDEMVNSDVSGMQGESGDSRRSSNKSAHSMKGIQSHPQIQDYFLRGMKRQHEEATLELNLNELLEQAEQSEDANLYYESNDTQEVELED